MAKQLTNGASTGGQWNFSGVLYQLLATLKSGLDATIEEVMVGRDGASVRIVVEPASGGDAQTIQPGRRRVDQIKIRRGKAPWTLRTIVEKVLPNLHNAASDGAQPTEFRFITDNRDGTCTFEKFASSVRAKARTGNGPADLNSLKRTFHWGRERISERVLFERVVETLQHAPEDLVWQFLAAVGVEVWSEAAITNEVDAMLGELVDEREEISVKRKALVTQLLSLGGVGKPTSACDLLRAVDLDPARLTLARRLPEILRIHVADALQVERYDRRKDVRNALALPEAPVSVVSGESGQGKTWCLCRAAQELIDAGRCVMFLPARRSLADIETLVVDTIWRTAFDRSLPIARVAERLRPQLRSDDGIWLTLFLDDLTDPDLARELAAAPWARLGIRMVVSAQPRMKDYLRHLTKGNGRVADTAVPDFTLAELREYLRRAGRDPMRLPDDVLLSLTRPVLADIYCQIPGSERWGAVNEYELVDRYWRWATTENRTQTFHLFDEYAVLVLAGTLLDGNAVYPWTPSVLKSQQFSDEVLDRLVTVGVLRDGQDRVVLVSHDRILNWAVAGEIERRFVEREMQLDEVALLLSRLGKIETKDSYRIGRRLGYVLSDLFWKLARNTRTKPEQVGALALQAIRTGAASLEHERFFTVGLGSLGDAIIPALVWMARQAYSDEEWLVPYYLPMAFASVAESAPAKVASAAVELVEDGASEVQSIGLNVLRSVAAPPQSLDLLWSLHRERHAAMVAATSAGEDWSERRIAQEQSFEAVTCAARASATWLRAKARDVVESEDAEQLLWLLRQINVETTRPIWAECKHHLLALVSPTSIAVPLVIRYFQDRVELLARIDAILGAPEANRSDVLGYWFDALARLEPEQALDRLGQLSSRQIWWTGDSWLCGLLLRLGTQTHERLVETVGCEQANGEQTRRNLAVLYQGKQDLLDAPTLDLMIDSFESLLEREERGEAVQPGAHHHLRSLIASVASPVLLERLAARKGSRFEVLLARHSTAREGRNSMLVDGDGGEYRWILAAIGGEGYDQLVLAELSRSNPHARIDGLTVATWTLSTEVRAMLEAIADDPDSDTYFQVQLMRALSSHRADAGIRTMVRSGSPIDPRAVRIRQDGPPWSDEETCEIERLVNCSDTKERRYGIKLCCFLNAETVTSILAAKLADDALSEEDAELILRILSNCGGYAPSSLPQLRRRLTENARSHETARYLAFWGDTEARNAVGEWLATRSREGLPIAFRLLYFEDSAAGALTYLRRIWKSGRGWADEGRILAALADAGDSEASAALEAIAYQKPHYGDESVVAGIRAIAKVSPDEAFAAAQRFYLRSRANSAVCLLLELNVYRGTEVLLEDYARAPIPVRHQIGRSLRRAGARRRLIDTLADMSESTESGGRLTAAELAGWLPFEERVEFLDRLIDDESHEVEAAALTALRQRRADAYTAALIAALPHQPRPRQWAWLVALIRCGDPALFADPDDPRAIHTLLDQLGEDFREEANSVLNKRSTELAREAERQERHRCR